MMFNPLENLTDLGISSNPIATAQSSISGSDTIHFEGNDINLSKVQPITYGLIIVCALLGIALFKKGK